MTLECQHGQLKRSCDICFLEKEIETLRAKLVKADALAEQAAITISYAYYMEPAFYLGLESSLKEYRVETQ